VAQARSKAPAQRKLPAKRKLKVFQAQLGFYDTVVAVPGRAAALRAWGVHQDLFAGRTPSTPNARRPSPPTSRTARRPPQRWRKR